MYIINRVEQQVVEFPADISFKVILFCFYFCCWLFFNIYYYLDLQCVCCNLGRICSQYDADC
jgi:hypothetical protein